jgi:hypothetical protein
MRPASLTQRRSDYANSTTEGGGDGIGSFDLFTIDIARSSSAEFVAGG